MYFTITSWSLHNDRESKLLLVNEYKWPQGSSYRFFMVHGGYSTPDQSLFPDPYTFAYMQQQVLTEFGWIFTPDMQNFGLFS